MLLGDDVHNDDECDSLSNEIPFVLLAFDEDELAFSSAVDVFEVDHIEADGVEEFKFEISIVFSLFDAAVTVPASSWSFMMEIVAVTALA